MQFPPVLVNEPERLASLIRHDILDTKPETRFDEITKLGQRLFETSICLISLVDSDRQWFKSNQGLGAVQTSRAISFCAHAIAEEFPLVINDATQDIRFADNPLVLGEPHIRFYAGAPLVDDEGMALGTFCIIDSEVRKFASSDIQLLQALADIAMSEIELRTFERLQKPDRVSKNIDASTRAFSRSSFDVIFAAKCALADRENRSVNLILIDVDILAEADLQSSELGYERYAAIFADLVRQITKGRGLLSRLGRTRFAILLGGLEERRAEIMAQRILDSAQRLRVDKSREQLFLANAGVASRALNQQPAEVLLVAERCLEKANAVGKSLVFNSAELCRIEAMRA